MGIHRDVADAVLLPLVDGDVDHPAALGVVEARIVRHDPEIGIAVLQVVAADQFEVGGDPVRIINVRSLDEAEEIGFRRGHQIAQARRRIHAVAGEIDLLDAGLAALDDGENDVRTAVRQRLDAAGNGRGAIAGTTVDFLEALDVGVDQRLAPRAVGLGLDLAEQDIALQATVTLEGDAVDRVVLLDGDDGLRAATADLNIGEESGGEEILTNLRRVPGTLRGHVGADRLRIDAPVSLDNHGLRKHHATAYGQHKGRKSD